MEIIVHAPWKHLWCCNWLYKLKTDGRRIKTPLALKILFNVKGCTVSSRELIRRLLTHLHTPGSCSVKWSWGVGVSVSEKTQPLFKFFSRHRKGCNLKLRVEYKVYIILMLRTWKKKQQQQLLSPFSVVSYWTLVQSQLPSTGQTFNLAAVSLSAVPCPLSALVLAAIL